MRLPARSFSPRRGFSLIEMLASLVITLIVMGATVQLFGTVGSAINNGRAGLEQNDRVRSAQQVLRNDLLGHTCDTLVWQRPEAAAGYLEILKGPGRDSSASNYNSTLYPNGPSQPGALLTGYTGDALFLTVRSRGLPFIGRATINGNATTIESQVAEVIWFMQPSVNPNNPNQPVTNPPTFTLYRRVLLVRPDLLQTLGPLSANNFYDTYDLSAHADGNGNMIPNSLADLCYRENRYGHNPTSYPFLINPAAVQPFPNTDSRFGEDVVLTNVLSFDLKVWDPLVPVLWDPTKQPDGTVPTQVTSRWPLVPSDVGYPNGAAFSPAVFGAYVDLNFASTLPNSGNYGASYFNPTSGHPTYFSGPSYGLGNLSSLAASSSTSNYATYDLWSLGYEYYVGTIAGNKNSQAANGFDDLGSGGVDNPNERLTCPPYPVPLRGMQVKIRVFEPTTQNVREVTVAETFMAD